MTGPPELRISWSSLRGHQECRNRTGLLRAGKRSPMSDIRVFFPGTVADRVMREWLDDPEHPPGGMERMVSEIMDREEALAKENGDGVVRWRNRADRTTVLEFCTELASRFEPFLRTEVLPYPFAVAQRFKVPVNIPYLDGTPRTIYLTGETDIEVFPTPSTMRVWDLKATADASYHRKVIGQMVFYALTGLLRFPERSVEYVGIVQPMCPVQNLRWEVTEQQRAEIMAAVIQMATDIWSKWFPLADATSVCWNCPVKPSCERYSPQSLIKSRLSLGEMLKVGSCLLYTSDAADE